MALTDTFVKNAKHSGSPSGDKHRDGGGMFLLVSASGKYWRMDCWRRLNFDHLCRLNLDQGLLLV